MLSKKNFEGASMKLRIVLMSAVLTVCCAAQGQAQSEIPTRHVEYIKKEVRHELLMLPYLDVFNNVAYRVDGYEVTLIGQVTRPLLKSDAERVVKRVEGVTHVNNEIEVPPLSPFDDRLRFRLFQVIYGYAPLQNYALSL